MTLQRIIAFNALLILAAGIYGFATDEFYWRAVGHAPWLYDYLFWFALALNGPSGVLADWSGWALGSGELLKYLAQYGFWLMLFSIQWALYAEISTWANSRPRRMIVYLSAAMLFVAGSIALAKIRLLDTGVAADMEHHIDFYFWPVRIIGLMLAGFWISLLTWRRASGVENRVTARPGVTR